MSRKLIYVCVVTVIVTLTGAVRTYAQEAAMMDIETIDTETDRLRDKMIYSPGESSGTKLSPVSIAEPKDSIINTHTNTQSTTAKNSHPAQAAEQVHAKPKQEKIPAAKQVAQQKAKSDDESILSFNFLYYIIEKYKLQDIVD